MGPAAQQPSSSSVTRQSFYLSPLKPHVSTAAKLTTRGPHTPPEQSPSRPGASPPTLLYVPTKHHPTKPANVMNNTDLPKHGQQQQQQQQEPQGGEWTRQTARRRKAQHGKRVQASKPSRLQASTDTTAKQAPRAKPSSRIKTSQSHDNQRQAASNIADLPPKAASLTEAADRHPRHIKPASWAPTSYSAAVWGLPPFGLMWSRLWWATGCP